MPFTIPDNDVASNPGIQSVWYATDVAILISALNLTGVISNCVVSAQSTPNMTVAVAAGTIMAAGTSVAVTTGNLTVGTADATNPRIDLISVSAAGVKTITPGTAAVQPKPPALPSGHVGLATVLVAATTTTITSGAITDKRAVLPSTFPGTGGGGGGGGGSVSSLLNYSIATDTSGGSVAATTWTDICPNQSFTVASGGDLVQVVLRTLFQFHRTASGDHTVKVRLVIDSAGTPVNIDLGGDIFGNVDYHNPLVGNGSAWVSGLAAGSHTIKAQVWSTGVGDYYLRAATTPEFLTIQVTEHGAALPAGATARAARRAGSYTLNSTSWANVDTGLDLVVAAATNDVLEISLSALWGAEAVVGMLDVATIVSAAVVNVISGGGGSSDQGVMAWYGSNATASGSLNIPAGGNVQYVVQAGDISGGNVTLRLRYRTGSASNKTLFGTTPLPFQWAVVNHLH